MSGRPLLGVVFISLMSGLSGSVPALAASTTATACALFDLAVFNLIEMHGEDQGLPAEIVADAATKLIEARVAGGGRERRLQFTSISARGWLRQLAAVELPRPHTRWLP